MKKITLLLALCLSFTMMNATVIIDEIFDYAATNLASEPSWTTTGTLTTGTGRNIVTPALTYSNSGGTYILSGEGKAIHAVMSNTSSYLTVKTLPSTQNSGEIYFSYLYKAGVVQTQAAVEVFGLGTGTSAGPRIWVGKTANAGYWKFGITRSSTTAADVSWNTQEFNDVNEVVLLVIKYDFSNLTASFYINPTLNADKPDVPAATNNNGTGRTSLNNLWFRAQGTSMFNYMVSGARLSTTWAEAVAVKSESAVPLAAPVVGSASSIGAESFTANWTAVTNATGYAVKVYQGETLQGTYDADGQSTESLFIKGLLTNTTYTYKVIAKGDAIDYSNSEESLASAEFTTLEGLTSINTAFNDETWGTLYTSENQPAAAAFPSSYHNGFDILNTFLYDITRYDSRGERKEYGLRMDRMSNGGMVVLPTVKSLEQIEIHAIPGGAPRSVTLKELVDGVWTTVGTYEMTSSVDYTEFIIPLSRAVPTKLRIENAGTGQVTLYQIITRTTNPALLDAPAVGVATSVNATHFTANWTAVANATGYKVRVYQGTTLVKTVDVSGQSAESVQVTGLDPETEYTYKVLAVGDNFVDYADSYLSAASAPITTGITSGTESLSAFKLTVSGKSIQASETGTFEVYSLQGAKVYQVKNAAVAETGLPKGLYILQFTHANGKQTTQKITIN